MLDRNGNIDWMIERWHEPPNSDCARHPAPDLLRIRFLPLGQGWRDESDVDRLCRGPSLRVASQIRRAKVPLDDDHGLASHPTLSRLLKTLTWEENRPVLYHAVTELAYRRIEMIEGGRRS